MERGGILWIRDEKGKDALMSERGQEKKGEELLGLEEVE